MYLLWSKKVTALGAARLSGATSTMRRPSSGAAGAAAPVNAAISANVRPCACLWNSGSLMPSLPCRHARPRSELGAAAEAEELRTIVARLGQGVGKIETQRPERRVPDQAHADRRSDRLVVGDLELFAGDRPRRLALIIPQRAGVGESGDLDADFLRQEVQRRLRLEARAPIHGAAEGIVGAARRQVARTDAGGREAAHQVRTHLEVVEHAQLLTAPAVQDAALQAQHADDVGEELVVVAGISGGADEIHVAADTGEILLEFEIKPAGRALGVVERIVGQRIADDGLDHQPLESSIRTGSEASPSA